MCSPKKGVRRLFFNWVQNTGWGPATFLKKDTLAEVFLCIFCKLFKRNFLQPFNTCGLRSTASVYVHKPSVNYFIFSFFEKKKHFILDV